MAILIDVLVNMMCFECDFSYFLKKVVFKFGEEPNNRYLCTR